MRGRMLSSAATRPWPLWLPRDANVLRGLGFALGAALLGACGDDVREVPVGGRGADVSGSGGAAARSGNGSAGRAAARGGAGPGFPVLPNPPELTITACGTARCVSPAAGFGFVTACCADEATSVCGIMTLSGECMKPDPGDPRCPALNFRGIVSLPSCCTGANQCGLDPARVGMPGCIELTEAIKQARLWGVSDEEIPEPRSCDPSGGAADAGVEDAGG